ncbi:MAG: hypothetical protein JWO04_2692 [Gammaproteobacteria bacterium]|nr:hypothetical protein [Gammaproteobacteria bacterium]
MFSPLVLKLLLVPSFIGLVSLAERRWGPTVAGWLAGLPVVVGPILFLLWLEQGAKFSRSATVYSLAAMVPVAAFAVVYAWSSRRWAWPVTTVLAYGIWLLFAVTVLMLPVGIVSATVLAAGSLVIAPRVFPRQMSKPVIAQPPKFDIKVRMLAGVVLTLLVTSIANIGGTRVSGILSMFPVISSILAVSIHRSGGSDAAIAVLRGLASGLWSLGAFCATLVIVPAAGAGYAFGAATAVAIGVQALVPRR